MDKKHYWKSLTIADTVTFLKATMDKLEPESVNACWKNEWSEVVNYFKASWGLMEKLANSFTGEDKLMEKDILSCLMKWNNILKAIDKYPRMRS